MRLTRRQALALSAAVPALAGPRRKSVAFIFTEYRRNAHADVIGTRLLEGYEYYGKRADPRVEVVSMHAEQFPKNDMARAMAAKHRVPMYDSIREALTRGGSSLAVDGVIIVGEHGDYPHNEKGQHMYPRYDLFKSVVDVFESSGRAVPVFCDKHLSYDWTKAKWMYDQSRRLKFPMLAGSSLPLAWRHPALEIPYGTKFRRAVSVGYGDNDAYGFHALETLQCMVERRAGGETGVRAVQAFAGAEAWRWTEANPWARTLLDAALAKSETRKAGRVEDLAKKPLIIALEYVDGFEAAMFMLNGVTSDFLFAAEIRAGKSEPAASHFWLQPGRFFGHFSGLVHFAEELVIKGKEPYPVERTLLTTGVLAAGLDSAFQGGKRLETPHLAIRYAPARRDYYNRGPVPVGEAEAL